MYIENEYMYLKIGNCCKLKPTKLHSLTPTSIMNLSTDVKDLMKSFFTDEEMNEQKQLYISYLNKRKVRTSNKTKKELLNIFLNSEVLEDFLRSKFNECLRNDFRMFVSSDVFSDDDYFTNSVFDNLETIFVNECKERKHFSSHYLLDFIKNSDVFQEKMKACISKAFIDNKSTAPNKIDVDYLFMKLKSMDTENYNYSFITNIVNNFDPLDNVFRIHEITTNNGASLSNEGANLYPTHILSDCERDFIADDTIECDNFKTDFCMNDNLDFDNMTKINEDTCIIFKHYNDKLRRNPTNEEINDIKFVLGNKLKLIEVIHSHLTFTKGVHFNHLVNSFEEIFERPISIFEFKKYYNDSLRWDDHSRTQFDEYYQQKKELYAKAQTITKNTYKLFVEKDIDDFHMIRFHWDTFDAIDYEKLLIDYLTNRPEYDEKMRTCIETIYMKQFGEKLEPYNLEYILYHIKSKQLHTKSDELIVIINDLYTETSRFKDLIGGVFDMVLEREPDKLEIKDYVTKFRKDLSNSIDFDEQYTVDIIRDDLYGNIEYNDILKRNIIRIGDDKLLPSQINNILSKIVNWDTNHQLKKNYDSLVEFVKQEMK